MRAGYGNKRMAMDTKGLSGAEALLRLLARMGVERIFA